MTDSTHKTDLPLNQPAKSSRNLFFKRYENQVDKYGFNPTPFKPVETFTRFYYKYWFNVQVAGLENIPAEDQGLLFGNHSGGIPVDGFLFYDGLINNHPSPRRLRFLVTSFLMKAGIIGKTLRAFGCVSANYDTAVELLREQELVFLYPEAEKGTGKLYKDRYKLQEFHSGFVRAAIETGAPLIPVVTIGGDELYPMFANCKPMAKILKWPYFPLTPFFPWLPFPLCTIPLPVKIAVTVWRPFKLKYPPEAAHDLRLVDSIVTDIRNDIQIKVNDLLAIRTSPFSNWNMKQVNAYLRQGESYWPRSEKHREQP